MLGVRLCAYVQSRDMWIHLSYNVDPDFFEYDIVTADETSLHH
jgi:hypothetical protein